MIYSLTLSPTPGLSISKQQRVLKSAGDVGLPASLETEVCFNVELDGM